MGASHLIWAYTVKSITDQSPTRPSTVDAFEIYFPDALHNGMRGNRWEIGIPRNLPVPSFARYIYVRAVLGVPI